jgi:hypothetical protein
MLINSVRAHAVCGEYGLSVSSNVLLAPCKVSVDLCQPQEGATEPAYDDATWVSSCELQIVSVGR